MCGKSRIHATITKKDRAGPPVSGLWLHQDSIGDRPVFKMWRVHAGFALKTHPFATFPPRERLENAQNTPTQPVLTPFWVGEV